MAILDEKLIVEKYGADLKRLTKLLLISNSIQSIDSDVFEKLINLGELDLYHNNLTAITPKTFEKATSLTKLRLSSNKLKTIQPKSFDRLSNLVELDLSWNRIENLHYKLFNNLKKLNKLGLSSYKWTKITDATLESIAVLTVPKDEDESNLSCSNFDRQYSNNKLTSLDPRLFENLVNLTELDLSYNHLTYLHPKTFDKLVNLVKLNLSWNHLISIDPKTFDKLLNLSKLYLNTNQLKEIEPKTFDKLINLKELYINDNKVTFFYFKSLNKLERLELKEKENILEKLKKEQRQETIFIIERNGSFKIITRNEYYKNEYSSSSAKPDSKYDSVVLKYSAIADDYSMIDLLRAKNVAMLEPNENGHSAIHLAAMNGNTTFLKYFLNYVNHEEKKSMLEVEDVNGQTPLLLAGKNGFYDMIVFLLSYNVNINHQDHNGNTLTHLLLRYKQTEVLESMFKSKYGHKIELDMKNKNGQTALHIASEMSNESAIYLLCSFNSFVDMMDNQSRTPLQLAMLAECEDREKKKRAILALINNGADYTNAVQFAQEHDQINELRGLFQNVFLEKGPFTHSRAGKKVDKMSTIRNLVFQGGSVKGIAYLGAIEALEKNRFDMKNIKRLGGTSAGAITAVLLGMGYTRLEIKKMLEELDFVRDLLDGNKRNEFLLLKDKIEKNGLKFFVILGNLSSLKKFIGEMRDGYGIFSGDNFRKFIEDKIFNKLKIPNATFREMNDFIMKTANTSMKQLYFIGTNLTTRKSQIFSYEHTPDVIISDAVRISMSIPFLFKAHNVWIKDKNNKRVKQDEQLYVDGGLLNATSYPLWLFDNSKYLNERVGGETGHNNGFFFINRETLGFSLVNSKQKDITEQKIEAEPTFSPADGNDAETKDSKEISSLYAFLSSIVKFYLDSEQFDQEKRVEDLERTVYIDTIGVSALDFNLSRESKTNLYNSGYKAAFDYCLKQIENASDQLSLSPILLGSLLKVCYSQIFVQGKNKFSIKNFAVDEKSPHLPGIFYEYYSKGELDDLIYIQRLKLNLKAKDEQGNNVLHIAASKFDLQCMKNLKDYEKIIKELDELNEHGQSVLDKLWTSHSPLNLSKRATIVSTATVKFTDGSSEERLSNYGSTSNQSIADDVDDISDEELTLKREITSFLVENGFTKIKEETYQILMNDEVVKHVLKSRRSVFNLETSSFETQSSFDGSASASSLSFLRSSAPPRRSYYQQVSSGIGSDSTV